MDEKTTSQTPVRLSMREFGFKKDGDKVVLIADYWINTVAVSREELINEGGKASAMRKLVPENISKRYLEISLERLENPELYDMYINLLDKVREAIINLDSINEDSDDFKRMCQDLINKDKEDELKEIGSNSK